MNLEEIRRTILVAIASDDVLADLLVLKGGNALALVHRIGRRTSLDVDYSLPGDLDEVDIARRLERALTDRFDSIGLVVFDFKFNRRPSQGGTEDWGGYTALFKLIPRELKQRYGEDTERMRREAVASGPQFQRVFEIEMSKHEYCDGKVRAVIDEFPFYVCPPLLIAVEKLRAICQQMHEYPKRKHPAPRSRDFYDVYSILTESGQRLDTDEAMMLFKNVFLAKQVPLELLGNVGAYKEFHRQDWANVRDSVQGDVQSFDFYFAFVLEKIEALRPLWNV